MTEKAQIEEMQGRVMGLELLVCGLYEMLVRMGHRAAVADMLDSLDQASDVLTFQQAGEGWRHPAVVAKLLDSVRAATMEGHHEK